MEKSPPEPKEKKDGWYSIEDFMREVIWTEREKEVIQLMQSLPEKTREKYRELWKQLKSKRAR